MSSVGGYSELTRFDNKLRLMGMSNSFFNTNDLVEAELTILDAQATPKRNQKALLTDEKAVWEEFKKMFTSLTDSFSGLRFYKTGTKSITYGTEGVINLTATSMAQESDYMIKVNKLAERHQISGKDMGAADMALGLEDTVKIKGKELEITTDMNLRDIVNAINGGDYGASASIISNRLVVTSKEYGEANSLLFEDGINGSLKGLGVLADDGTFANELKKAQDSELVVNGITMTRATNVVTDAIDGVTINLNNISNSEIRVSVKNNQAEAMKAVENMVNAYNKSIMQYNSFTDKDTYLQGQSIPLAMRREMSQLTNFKSVDGQFLFQFGVQVDGTAKDGTLKMDKTKLEEMYRDNPEQFEKMFFGEHGLGKFMEQKMMNYTGATGSISKKIEGMQKSIDSINDSLKQFDTYYENQKNTILKKYTAFESMMARLNSELSYMEAQLSSLTGSNNKK